MVLYVLCSFSYAEIASVLHKYDLNIPHQQRPHTVQLDDVYSMAFLCSVNRLLSCNNTKVLHKTRKERKRTKSCLDKHINMLQCKKNFRNLSIIVIIINLKMCCCGILILFGYIKELQLFRTIKIWFINCP